MIQQIDYPNNGGPDRGPNPRIETGAVQFGKDWTGLFIRGDNCLELALAIERITPLIQPNNFETNYALQILQYYAEIIKTDVIQKPSNPKI